MRLSSALSGPSIALPVSVEKRSVPAVSRGLGGGVGGLLREAYHALDPGSLATPPKNIVIAQERKSSILVLVKSLMRATKENLGASWTIEDMFLAKFVVHWKKAISICVHQY